MKKKNQTKAIVLIVFVSILLFATIFYLSHRTYYAYNDWWIQGKSMEQVEARYGKSKECSRNLRAYFLYRDNGAVMPSQQEIYYYMQLDENGKVIKVYKGIALGG
ncbi:hypothetical protein lbkm_3854 [Lachnospiraceae bacterium KM106-2]|nr:hypothetical protein lbkm_3854 [Lachnospiraceae bacterium KM106-2]